MTSAIEAIVKKYNARIRDDRIFFAPQIPAKKLNNALNDYAREAHGEPVLALIDNSFFGSAKDGLLLTAKHIYSNEWSSTTFSLEQSAIESVAFVQTDSSKEIHLNDIAFATVHMAHAGSVEVFAEMLDEIRQLFHPSAQEVAAKQPRAGKCASCGAAYKILPNHLAPTCAYCGSSIA